VTANISAQAAKTATLVAQTLEKGETIRVNLSDNGVVISTTMG
jgi:hypothetical protein